MLVDKSQTRLVQQIVLCITVNIQWQQDNLYSQLYDNDVNFVGNTVGPWLIDTSATSAAGLLRVLIDNMPG